MCIYIAAELQHLTKQVKQEDKRQIKEGFDTFGATRDNCRDGRAENNLCSESRKVKGTVNEWRVYWTAK